MSKRSKACDITPKVRREVMERDKCCVNCGSHHTLTIAHVFKNRSHGGLGIKQNLLVLCRSCHHAYDNSKHRQTVKQEIKSYLMSIYADWNEDELVYRKWG